MEILLNCKTINKRYGVNGTPLYDITCTHKEEYITIKGISSYQLKNDTLYPYLFCDKVYTTPGGKTKAGYIQLTMDKITPTLKRAWLIDSIYPTSYSEDTGEVELDLSDKNKVMFFGCLSYSIYIY